MCEATQSIVPHSNAFPASGLPCAPVLCSCSSTRPFTQVPLVENAVPPVNVHSRGALQLTVRALEGHHPPRTGWRKSSQDEDGSPRPLEACSALGESG